MKIKAYLIMLLSMLIVITGNSQVSKSITKINKTIVHQSKELFNIEPNVQESFETYSDFAIEFSPWILNDVDGTVTYGITDVTWPNAGAAMAYIIFNPNNTSPSLDNDPELAAHSGDKYAACFSSVPSEGSTNNDWLITPILDLGINSSLSFYARSYTLDYGAEKLKVLVSTTGTDPSSFTEISPGTLELPAAWTNYSYDLSSFDGQSIYIAFQCISTDAFILMLDDILVGTEEVVGGSTLNGKVTDAVDGTPIVGALVEVAGLSDITDGEGNYSIENVPAGSLTSNFMATPTSGEAPLSVQFTDLSTSNTQLVSCSADGYITYNNNQVIIPEGTTVNLDISLSPTITGDEMRFVLNWGADPRDLDSHLRTPDIEGSEYHVYYSSQGSATGPPYATLDHDDTQSYGPETITIYQFFDGVYHYYIYNFAGVGELTESSAVVQIYNSSGILYTLQVPTTGTGKYWYVGTIDGSNQSLNIINTIQETEPGTGKTNVIYPPKLKQSEQSYRDITSWEWDFGDGQTSNQTNPSHIYENGGVYTVTLTVSDGVNQNTFTRENYINVEGSQGTSTLSGMVTDAVNGTPIAGALVEVAGLSDITDNEGNYTIENVPAGSLTSNFMANPTSGEAPLSVQFTDLSTSNTQLVSCSASGYITYNNNQVIIPEGTTVNLDISLSPTITGDEMRFVLNWGADPRDLDSHLRTPSIEGSEYHVFYSSQGSSTSAPYAVLDHDDTQSYGPETITIYQFFDGVYHFYVHNYAGTGEIIESSAVVQIYNSNGLLYTLQVPTSGTGKYWYVGTIDGSSQSLNIINTIQETEPGTGKRNVKYPEKPKPENNQRFEINSWNWDFGDGNTSSEQNPSHIYQDESIFDVSLTVSDGINEETITKYGYIVTSSEAQIISVAPNEASQGETLTVTITGSGTHFTQGSNQIWFQQGTSVIYPNYYSSPNNETIEVEFTFTSSHSEGLYDVFVSNSQDGEIFKLSAFTLGPNGINDLLTNQVKFYPNPIRHNLNIDFGEINRSKTVRIIDISGRIILERMHVNQNEVFDLSAYDNGMYIVCIIVDNHVLYEKIIKR